MARIAGILSLSVDRDIDAEMRQLLAGFKVPSGEVSVLRYGPLAIGAMVAAGGGAAVAQRGSLMATLDGSIFNAREFGNEERAPVEIVLELVERFGFEVALSRINGDFAVAVYDTVAGTLQLARDRFGVKPIYYTRGKAGLAFASHSGKLLRLPWVSPELNRTYVGLVAGSHYRTFDNDPNTSPFAQIAQLPAGHLLEVGGGGAVSLRRYWTLVEEPEWSDSEDALAERYQDLLTDAVRMRFAVARRPAFTLSGGMDSSSVLACAARVSGTGQHAFSTVYQDRTFDESDEIRSMLGNRVAEWHPIHIGTPDVFATVVRMVEAHDEPVATATWLSHFLLCEQVAAQGFGALFGGLGGDELNAGEYEYFFFNFADLRRAGDEATLRSEVAFWARYHDHAIYRKDLAVAEAGLARLVDLRTPGVCLVDRSRVDRYGAAVNPDFFDVSSFEPVMDHPFRSFLKNRTFQDIFRETAPCCLRAEDRQTTSAGLDHFDPFFDHRLVEFMFRVPGRLKIRDGVTKVLLREAMRGILPEETRTRIKKTGWNAPAHVWFSGEGLDAVRDLVGSRAFRERGVYSLPDVERIIDEHETILGDPAPRENHMMFLWQLVNLELWLQRL